MKPTMLSRAQAYLAYRRALGFELQSEGTRLLNFARYADGLGHRGPLTTELAIRWASLPQKADRRYWASRLEIIRRFARHLLLSEPKTQVPPRHLLGPAYRRNPPHLYSSGEIQHLLRRASQLKGRLRPHTFQTLIGLLVCSGLRISEALNLKTSDVDLEQLVVVVRQSKCRLPTPATRSPGIGQNVCAQAPTHLPAHFSSLNGDGAIGSRDRHGSHRPVSGSRNAQNHSPLHGSKFDDEEPGFGENLSAEGQKKFIPAR